MFTLTETPAYFWPVVVRTPTDDGAIVESQFDAKFRRFTQDEMEAMAAEIAAGKLNDTAMAKRITVGWRAVADKADNEIAFTDGNLDKLLAQDGMGTWIVRAFNDSRRKAAEKN